MALVVGEADRQPQTRQSRSEQLNKAAEIAGGKAWGLDKGKPRIYLNSRRDKKVYIGFEDAAYTTPNDTVSAAVSLGGGKVCVFIEECGQHKNWYASERSKSLEAARAAFDAVEWFLFSGNEEEALRFAAGELVIDDETAGHMVNGREAEARERLGL